MSVLRYDHYVLNYGPRESKGSYVGQAYSSNRFAYPDNAKFSDGYWYEFIGLNNDPVVSVSTTVNMAVSMKTGYTLIKLTGNVHDPDGDAVTVSAAIGGIQKTFTVSPAPTSLPAADNWSLTWDLAMDQVPEGRYSNVVITASDNK